MQNLISTWREAFSGGPASENTTPSDFPFGIVSLAGGTSEGHGSNMGAFRLAQAGGTGLLPNGRKGWENTFVAQAFDLGEPGDGAASMANEFDGQGPYASQRGAAPHTNFFSEYPAQPLAAIRQHHRLLHRLSHVDPSLTTRSGSLALLEKHHETRQHSGRNPPQVCARFELYNAVSVQGASPSAPYVAPCTPFSVPALASH